MRTMKLSVLAVLSTILVGCGASEAADSAATDPAVDSSPAKGSSTNGSTGASPCDNGTPADAPSGPALAASPVAKCGGFFHGETLKAGPIPDEWLRRTPQGCMLGTSLVLHEDGTVTSPTNTEMRATWAGDEFVFTVAFENYSYVYTRALGEKSQ